MWECDRKEEPTSRMLQHRLPEAPGVMLSPGAEVLGDKKKSQSETEKGHLELSYHNNMTPLCQITVETRNMEKSIT